jgi:hypothetical protein
MESFYPYEFTAHPVSPLRLPIGSNALQGRAFYVDLNIHRKYLFLHFVCLKNAFIDNKAHFTPFHSPHRAGRSGHL